MKDCISSLAVFDGALKSATFVSMNTRRALLLTLGIIALLPITASASDLGLLLKKKEENAVMMLKYYRNLSSLADRNMQRKFCESVAPMEPVLTKGLADDLELITALYAEKDPDSYDYAKHLDENSLSDFFAFNIHQERCRTGAFDPIKQWQEGLRYSVMNVEYLLMAHRLWMEAHI